MIELLISAMLLLVLGKEVPNRLLKYQHAKSKMPEDENRVILLARFTRHCFLKIFANAQVKQSMFTVLLVLILTLSVVDSKAGEKVNNGHAVTNRGAPGIVITSVKSLPGSPLEAVAEISYDQAGAVILQVDGNSVYSCNTTEPGEMDVPIPVSSYGKHTITAFNHFVNGTGTDSKTYYADIPTTVNSSAQPGTGNNLYRMSNTITNDDTELEAVDKLRTENEEGLSREKPADNSLPGSNDFTSYTVTASAGSGGTISPPYQTVTSGGTATFSASPNTGYYACSCSGGTLSGNTVTVSNVTSNRSVSVQFCLNSYTISSSVGNGGSISPSGSTSVTHGGSCSFSISPSTGYVIANVLVDGSDIGAASSYTFSNVTSGHLIMAYFNKKTYTVTASAGSGGSISPSSQTVEHGENATFTVSANTGYYVSGYSGGTLSDNTVTVSNVTSNRSVSVSFSPVTYTISVSAGSGGSISPSSDVTVAHGNSQSFTISPDTEYNISNVVVDGQDLGVRTSYTFSNVTASHYIAAYFSIKTFTVTASAGSGGSISPTPQTVDYGGTATFTVSPNTGYYVSGCSGGTLSGNTVTVSNVTSNRTVSVSFSPITYTISASAGSGGSISPSGSVLVSHGNSQSFTITADTGYDLSALVIDGAAVTPASSYTFSNVTSDHMIMAVFEKETRTISASAQSGGSISPSGNITIEYGSDAAFTITPATYYYISDVVVDGVSQGTVSSYAFEDVTDNHSIAASFHIKPCITTSPGTGGSITPGGSIYVNPGSSQTFDIQADAGYEITNVVIDGQDRGPITSYTFTNINSDHIILAYFVKTYVVSATVSEGGTVSPSSQVVREGGTAKFKVNPEFGYYACHLPGGGTLVDDTVYVNNVTANKEIYVQFCRITKTITASAGSGGSINPSGNVYVDYGNNQTFTIDPNPGVFISSIIVDGNTIAADTSYTFNDVREDHSITASFSCTVTSTHNEGGTVTPSSQIVNCGGTAKFKVNPGIGYYVEALPGGGTLVGDTVFVNNVMSNKEVYVHFARIANTIIANVNNALGGTITPEGIAYVSYGDNKRFDITPNPNYYISCLIVDGDSIAADTSYTFYDVTENKSIVACFERYIVIEVNPQPGGSITPSVNQQRKKGESISFFIKANEGYYISLLNISGQAITANITGKDSVWYTFYNLVNAQLIEPYFERKKYNVSLFVNPENTGTVTGSGEKLFGDTVVVTAEPLQKFSFFNWTVNDSIVSTDSIYTFICTGDIELTANFNTSAPVVLVPADISVPSEADSRLIKVYSNCDWAASTADSAWLDINPASGSNNGSFTVSFGQNTGSKRIGTVIVTCSLGSDTLTVTQNQGSLKWIKSGSFLLNPNSGRVGIGTSQPTEKLTVKGTIHAKEIIVEPGIVPDFVFEKDYKPNTLDEVEVFIKNNKHLPGIPSAVEVREKGLDLGKAQMTLLQKIEELSLYLISEKREIEKNAKDIEEYRKHFNDTAKFKIEKQGR